VSEGLAGMIVVYRGGERCVPVVQLLQVLQLGCLLKSVLLSHASCKACNP